MSGEYVHDIRGYKWKCLERLVVVNADNILDEYSAHRFSFRTRSRHLHILNLNFLVIYNTEKKTFLAKHLEKPGNLILTQDLSII